MAETTGETSMAKYRKKPIVVEAHQWYKNGDHPQDGNPDKEGKLVRYFRHPSLSEYAVCEKCRTPYNNHGWLKTPEGGFKVCPGDWIITGITGEHYPCKPKIFHRTYERVLEEEEVKTGTVSPKKI